MASKSMRDCRNMQFIKWNLRLGCPALSNTQKKLIFFGGLPVALTGHGLFWARLKRPEKYGLQFFDPDPAFYSGFRAGPYGPAHFDSSSLLQQMGQKACHIYLLSK